MGNHFERSEPRGMISFVFLSFLLAGCHGQANFDMCYKTSNPLGTCGCDQQLFINDDCTQGFLCRDDIVLENPANDGCLIQCNMGWKLVADPRNAGHWYCTNISTPICPGKFNTECACSDPTNCPIGDCECDGQLRVSQDCKTAHYCDSTLATGYQEITCSDPNEIVYVNLALNTWECNVDDGRCPGAFHVGCHSDSTTTTTTTTTSHDHDHNSGSSLGLAGLAATLSLVLF